MITIFEALDWVNKFDKSHLNGANQQLFSIARNKRTDKGAVSDILRAALAQSTASPLDSLDYSESLLNCAAIELERGLLDEARNHVLEARQWYQAERDPHGEAVALWMCGIVHLRSPEMDLCYQSFHAAIKMFEDLEHSHRHAPDTQSWYKDILCKMNQDLVTIPHEVYKWLTRFRENPSHLSSSNRQLVKNLDVNIKNKQTTQAYQVITELKASASTSPNHLENAEIYVETGLATYRMNAASTAIEDLQYALTKYPIGGHYAEVSRWMLGAIQWPLAGRALKAKSNWENSIGSFKQLALKADRMNQDKTKKWYNEKFPLMEEALREKISEYL
jgi:tetratricopeptide (TPR) repeat protein